MSESPHTELLLENRYTPITREFALLNCDVETAVEKFTKWQGEIAPAGSCSVETLAFTGGIEVGMQKLLPLELWPSRQLFAATADPKWTAVFENCSQTPDHLGLTFIMLTDHSVGSIRIIDLPDSLNVSTGKGVLGAHMFHLVTSDVNRAVRVMRNEGGGWDFLADGPPQPFEILENYKRRLKKERLTHDMLNSYLASYQLFPFDPDFYPTDARSCIVQTRVSGIDPSPTFTLAEARRDAEDDL